MGPEGFNKQDWQQFGAMAQSVEEHGKAIGDLDEKTDRIEMTVGEVKSEVCEVKGEVHNINKKLDKALERRSGCRGVKSVATLGAIGASGGLGGLGLAYAALHYGTKIIEAIFGGG